MDKIALITVEFSTHFVFVSTCLSNVSSLSHRSSTLPLPQFTLLRLFFPVRISLLLFRYLAIVYPFECCLLGESWCRLFRENPRGSLSSVPREASSLVISPKSPQRARGGEERGAYSSKDEHSRDSLAG